MHDSLGEIGEKVTMNSYRRKEVTLYHQTLRCACTDTRERERERDREMGEMEDRQGEKREVF